MENNLKQIIKVRGLRQKWLAEQVGVTDTALSYWVNNHRQPSGVYLAKLIKLLECSAEEIYDV